MLKLVVCLISLVFTMSVYAGSIWDVKVHYQDKEIKTYQFTDTVSNLNLGNFPWKCSLEKVTNLDESSFKMAQRMVICRKGNISAHTFASCMTFSNGDKTLNSLGSPIHSLVVTDGRIHRSIEITCKAF